MLVSNQNGYIMLPTINQGAVAKSQFTITNNGTEEIEILSFSAGCGCTIPKGSLGKMSQNTSQEVEFSFNSKGKHGKNIGTIVVKWKGVDNMIRSLSQSFQVTVL